jgi:hypothetical protein
LTFSLKKRAFLLEVWLKPQSFSLASTVRALLSHKGLAFSQVAGHRRATEGQLAPGLSSLGIRLPSKLLQKFGQKPSLSPFLLATIGDGMV